MPLSPLPLQVGAEAVAPPHSAAAAFGLGQAPLTSTQLTLPGLSTHTAVFEQVMLMPLLPQLNVPAHVLGASSLSQSSEPLLADSIEQAASRVNASKDKERTEVRIGRVYR